MNVRDYSKHPHNGVLNTPFQIALRDPIQEVNLPLLPGSADVRFWSNFAVPADDQGDEPSCVGRAWAGWIECMVRRYVGVHAIPPGWQIDARAIWKRGRNMFWNGDLKGGLWLNQGLAAAVDLGILPPNTIPVRIASNWDSIGAALLQTPCVQAHAVSKGWYASNKENGCLDHVPAPDAGAHGFHCTLLLERLTRESAKFYLFENSWGADWGWQGLGLMTEKLWTWSIMANGLYTASLGSDLTAWRGWEKHLVQEGAGNGR